MFKFYSSTSIGQHKKYSIPPLYFIFPVYYPQPKLIFSLEIRLIFAQPHISLIYMYTVK